MVKGEKSECVEAVPVITACQTTFRGVQCV